MKTARYRRIFLVPFCLAVAALACLTPAGKKRPTESYTGGLSPQDVLYRMVSVYRSCNTYKDTGTTTTTFQGQHPFSTRISFRTFFVRPDKMRFEYSERTESQGFNIPDYQEFLLWTDATSVKTWWELGDQKPERKTWQTLATALASFNGVSDGTSELISCLLFHQKRCLGSRIEEMSKLKWAEGQRDQNSSCYVIEGVCGCNDANVRVSISKANWLIKEIIEKSQLTDNVDVKTKYCFYPVINEPIDSGTFTIKPPSDTESIKKAGTWLSKEQRHFYIMVAVWMARYLAIPICVVIFLIMLALVAIVIRRNKKRKAAPDNT